MKSAFMLAACPACSAKFNVPDEKIAGKRARMKCKRCSAMIPLDGMHLSTRPPSQSAPSSASPDRGTPPSDSPGSASASPAKSSEPPRASVRPETQPLSKKILAVSSKPIHAHPLSTEDETVSLGFAESLELSRRAFESTSEKSDAAEKAVRETLARTAISKPATQPLQDVDEHESATVVRSFDSIRALSNTAEESADPDDEVTRIFDGDPAEYEQVARELSLPKPAETKAVVPVAPAPPDETPTPVFPEPIVPWSGPSTVGLPSSAPTAADPRSANPSSTGPVSLQEADLSEPPENPPTASPLPLVARPPKPPTSPFPLAPSAAGFEIPSAPQQDPPTTPSALESSSPPVKKKGRGRLVLLTLLLLLGIGFVAIHFLKPELLGPVERPTRALFTRLSAWFSGVPVEPQRAEGPPFDTQTAGVVLERAAEQVHNCREPGGPHGRGRVKVLYAPTGRALDAAVSEPFHETAVGRCLVDLFSKPEVPAFGGDPVFVTKTFTLR